MSRVGLTKTGQATLMDRNYNKHWSRLDITCKLTSFPGLPRFCSLVCIQYNMQKRKSIFPLPCECKPKSKNRGGLGTRLPESYVCDCKVVPSSWNWVTMQYNNSISSLGKKEMSFSSTLTLLALTQPYQLQVSHCRLEKGLSTLICTTYRSMEFCNLCTRVFDRSDKNTMKFDDFIQCCVMLRSLTEGFKRVDTNRSGIVTISYEQVCG